MTIKENGDVYKLVQLARNGDINARNELLEKNYNLIIKKADECYNLIKNYYYHLNGRELTNYIIDRDEVIQDLSSRALEIINTYLNNDTNMYFSEYLNMMLKSYISKYMSKMKQLLIEKLDNEQINHLHFETAYFNKQEDRLLLKEIRELMENDDRLKNFTDFINLILSGYSYKELSDITNLSKRRLGMKIKYIAQIYQNIMNEFKTLNELKENDDVIKKIKNNQILEIDYYKKSLYTTLDKYYNNVLSNCDITYQEIEEDLMEHVERFIKMFFATHGNDIEKFNKLLNIYEKKYLYFVKTKVGSTNGKNRKK